MNQQDVAPWRSRVSEPHRIKNDRLVAAKEAIRECAAELDADEIACVMLEIELAQYIEWGLVQGFSLDLSDLQTVALAAALVAVREHKREAPLDVIELTPDQPSFEPPQPEPQPEPQPVGLVEFDS